MEWNHEDQTAQVQNGDVATNRPGFFLRKKKFVERLLSEQPCSRLRVALGCFCEGGIGRTALFRVVACSDGGMNRLRHRGVLSIVAMCGLVTAVAAMVPANMGFRVRGTTAVTLCT